MEKPKYGRLVKMDKDIEGVSEADTRLNKLPEIFKDSWIEFLRLYPHLRGRQRQIIDLIMSGMYRRIDIAKKLGMNPGDVSRELKKISQKIS